MAAQVVQTFLKGSLDEMLAVIVVCYVTQSKPTRQCLECLDRRYQLSLHVVGQQLATGTYVSLNR